MNVQLPPQIRKDVEEKTQPLVSQAREIYDASEKESPVIPPLDSYSEPLVHQKTYFHVSISPVKKSSVTSQPDLSSLVRDSNGVPLRNTPPTIIIQEEQAASNEKTWTLNELFNVLKKDAKSSEIKVLEKLFSRLREQIRKNDVKK
jgi:hypothetical protein